MRRNTISESIILAIEIVIIYGVVRCIKWKGNLATAKGINEKLNNFKNNVQ